MAGAPTKRSNRETSPSALRPAMLRVIDRRILARGEIDLPCVPALAETYVTRLIGTWSLIGKPFAPNEVDELRRAIELALQTGYDASPFARMIVTYQALPSPSTGVTYEIRLQERTMEEHYAHWMAERKPPLFGSLPDAKVLEMAESLGDPRSTPILDVGAGTGRNAVPLARRGHPTDALEVVTGFANEMRKTASEQGLGLEVIENDLLAPELSLAPDRYRLVVLSEVISHFRGLRDVELAFSRLAGALQPGGLVVANAFLSMDGYKPEAMARQISETAWSTLFTRAELDCIVRDQPFDKISDESAHDYEKGRAPTGEWPPTSWFVDWSQGRNVFDLPQGKSPVELRWLVYRRR